MLHKTQYEFNSVFTDNGIMDKNKILMSNIRLVQWIADRILIKYPQHREFREDWMQEAYIVALNSLSTWQPAKAKLSAYLSEALFRAFVRFIAKSANTIRTPEGFDPRIRCEIDDFILPYIAASETEYPDLIDKIEMILKPKNERYYRIFIDHYFNEIEYRDMSVKYRISVQRLCAICRNQIKILQTNKEFLKYANRI